MPKRILVTGGSGFIAGHTILHLLKAGYDVRISVRDEQKVAPVAALVSAQGLDTARMDYALADLGSDQCWDEAVDGCTGVFHMASPFPLAVPKNPDDLILPAKEGTLRVLGAARNAGIPRVILTSSIAAIAYGQPPRQTKFTEDDWTDVSGRDATAYVKSKAIAERAAWDFAAANGLELNVINPGLVLGPVLSRGHGTSVDIIRQIMTGQIPAIPNIGMNIVDVRDVADAHIKAFELDHAGERFIAAHSWLWFAEIAEMLRSAFPEHNSKIPTRKAPDLLLKIMALFNPQTAQIVPELGRYRETDNSKIKQVLDITTISSAEALTATGQSLIDLKII